MYYGRSISVPSTHAQFHKTPSFLILYNNRHESYCMINDLNSSNWHSRNNESGKNSHMQRFCKIKGFKIRSAAQCMIAHNSTCMHAHLLTSTTEKRQRDEKIKASASHPSWHRKIQLRCPHACVISRQCVTHLLTHVCVHSTDTGRR